MSVHVLLWSVLLSSASCVSFKVAVYEHAVVLPSSRSHVVTKTEAMELIEKNLNIYETQVNISHTQNVSIIIFPENGLYGPAYTRKALWPYLDFVPDPRKIQSWNPCEDPDRFSQTKMQYRLSCLARKNSLYVVANIGYSQPCDGSSCPADGHLQYSTDVVYDSNGTFIARYRKQNLVDEMQFNVPEEVDVVSFKTEFGNFGLITSWDMLYHDPVVTLVEELEISNLIVPNSWTDTAPFLTAIQFHSGFAIGMGVNVLAANLHLPNESIHGSGIYSPDGHAVYYYNKHFDRGKLIISELNALSKPLFKYRSEELDLSVFNGSSKVETTDEDSNNSFRMVINHDLFNLVNVSDAKGMVEVCHNHLCCRMEYSMVRREDEQYAFGAFDGFHHHGSSYYIQVCALLKCGNLTCGSTVGDINSTFTSLHIRGNFTTQFVFPELLVSKQGVISLAPKEFLFRDHSLLVKNSSLNLLSASLFARVYIKTSEASTLVMATLTLPLTLFMISLLK